MPTVNQSYYTRTTSASSYQYNSTMSLDNQSYYAHTHSLLINISNTTKSPVKLTLGNLDRQAKHQTPSPSIMDRYWRADTHGRFFATGQPTSGHQREMTAKQHQRKLMEREWNHRQQERNTSTNDRSSKRDAYEGSIATGQRRSGYQGNFQPKQYPRESCGYDGYHRSY